MSESVVTMNKVHTLTRNFVSQLAIMHMAVEPSRLHTKLRAWRSGVKSSHLVTRGWRLVDEAGRKRLMSLATWLSELVQGPPFSATLDRQRGRRSRYPAGTFCRPFSNLRLE